MPAVLDWIGQQLIWPIKEISSNTETVFTHSAILQASNLLVKFYTEACSYSTFLFYAQFINIKD